MIDQRVTSISAMVCSHSCRASRVRSTGALATPTSDQSRHACARQNRIVAGAPSETPMTWVEDPAITMPADATARIRSGSPGPGRGHPPSAGRIRPPSPAWGAANQGRIEVVPPAIGAGQAFPEPSLEPERRQLHGDQRPFLARRDDRLGQRQARKTRPVEQIRLRRNHASPVDPGPSAGRLGSAACRPDTPALSFCSWPDMDGMPMRKIIHVDMDAFYA
jgi:hypothetical protein